MTDKRVTVLVELRAGVVEVPDLLEAAAPFDEAMTKQQGFISMEKLAGAEGGSILSILRWESLEDHLRCMSSPEMFQAGARIMAMVKEGLLEMEVRVFQGLDEIC